MELVPLTVALLSVLVGTTYSWNQDSVLLRDIQALTFYKNRYTTARRSSPVPQLKCVGGSAGCHAFIPEVVQCVNRGWDGVDVQVMRIEGGPESVRWQYYYFQTAAHLY
ncbi:hypothetical protein GOODEAATRI_008368 [Goodea atripinnis]|uniref:Store-operated calcium entry-associated regulatory factor n=1 Tax=Goodea atripinnis TaxID=208336 RepID=A0ABV0NBD8_9TELE